MTLYKAPCKQTMCVTKYAKWDSHNVVSSVGAWCAKCEGVVVCSPTQQGMRKFSH